MTGNEMVMDIMENINNANETEGENTMNRIFNIDTIEHKFATKKDGFNYILNILDSINDENIKYKNIAIELLEHEIEIINKRAEAKKAKTTEKKENPINEKIVKTTIEILEESDKPMTMSEMIENPKLSTYITEDGQEKKMSIQKLASCIRLIDNVEKAQRKGKMYYSIKK